MKKLYLLIFLGFLFGISLPIVNFFVDQDPPMRFPAPDLDTPRFQAARDVMERKCVHCHVKDVRLPYYASWPGAKQLIEYDIRKGLKHFDLGEVLDLSGEEVVSEVNLARLELVTLKGNMPPLQYLAMHLRSFMDGAAKAAVLGWIYETRAKHYAVPGTSPEFQFHALQPIPGSVPVDLKKVELGRKLFHDVRLSKDNTLSCASCHDLAKGGTDRVKVSIGINGQKGPINSPTVYNSGLQFVQFWDGRAKDLEAQAEGPVHNPLEMGTLWEEVIPKLNQDLPLAAEFQAVYPEGFTGKNVQNALAEFEKTLLTPNSRFDKYLKGDASALNAVEREGFKLFMDKGCYICHVGKALGGQSFEKMGAEHNYFKDRGTPITEADQGRFNVTKDPKDLHKFKVPMLRNIAKTAPYFHDGSTSDLKEAVKIMARAQTEDGMSDEEASKVARFLETLTGEYQGQPVQ